MNPLLIDVPERIETPRLVLRCAREGDGAALAEAVRESFDRLQPWMPWAQALPTPEESEAAARRMHATFALREDLAFLVFERLGDDGEGLLLGASGLHRIDWTLPRFEIGYWLRSGFEGQGLATEVVRALTRLAFDRLGAVRVEIRMDERNARSRRVAERAGFSFEGLLRCEARAPDGSVRDTRVYARVRGVEEP